MPAPAFTGSMILPMFRNLVDKVAFVFPDINCGLSSPRALKLTTNPRLEFASEIVENHFSLLEGAYQFRALSVFEGESREERLNQRHPLRRGLNPDIRVMATRGFRVHLQPLTRMQTTTPRRRVPPHAQRGYRYSGSRKAKLANPHGGIDR